MLEKFSIRKYNFFHFKLMQENIYENQKQIQVNYLVVFGGQKFRSLVSDQSFSKKTPQMKNRNVAKHAKTDDVFHGHLFSKC